MSISLIKTKNKALYFTVVFAIVLSTTLFGMATQPESSLSIIWPTNAIIVGILLRYPKMAAHSAWLAVILGIVLASLILGKNIFRSGSYIYSLNDVAGAYIAWSVLKQSNKYTNLRKLQNLGYLLKGCFIAASAHAIIAIALALITNTDNDIFLSATNWFLGQLLSYTIFIPSILLIPTHFHFKNARRNTSNNGYTYLLTKNWVPASMLGIGIICTFVIGGPATLAMAIPPLVFCAVTYRQNSAIWLAAASCVIITYGIAYYPDPEHFLVTTSDRWSMASLRLGTLLIMLTPLAISVGIAQHNDTVKTLNRALDHDDLTKALSRGAYMNYAEQSIKKNTGSNGISILMIDIDHFKKLNDTYGHATGDSALKVFANTVRASIRPQDLFGRLGGEEFGLVLPNTSKQEAIEIANRIRSNVENKKMPIKSSDLAEFIQLTISVGISHNIATTGLTLDNLISQADQAMYAAKDAGRNSIKVYQNLI